MPSSTPYAVPTIASIARQLRPRSVLDVGIGFGKYGCLFREYLDVWEMDGLEDYDRERWRVVIDGVEATPEYITPLHDYVYDTIHIGDITKIIDGLGSYDVIIMGDVIEHFPKPIGEALVDKLYAHASRCLLLTFPPDCYETHDVLNNPYECHRSSWDRQDFRRFPNVEYKVFERRSALAALTKPSHTAPILTPFFGARRRQGWKGVVSTSLVRALGAYNASRLATWLRGEPTVLRA